MRHAENVDDLDEPSRLDLKVAQLHTQLDAPTPAWEYSRPLTFGGVPASTPYTFITPFDTPCEVCVISFVSAGATAIFGLLTDTDSIAAPADTAVLGNTGWSLAFAAAAITTVPMVENWYPVMQGQPLKLYVSGAGTKALWVNVQYRHRLTPAGVQTLGGY